MANKVLSIKMEEKDIDKLKQYHSILVDLGIISPSKLTFNGLLKHLLLDNLAFDFTDMLNTYSEYGIQPKYLNPEKINLKNEYGIKNDYELNEKEFDLYLQCFKERMVQRKQDLQEDVRKLSQMLDMEIEFIDDVLMELHAYPNEEGECNSFWLKRANEEIEYIEEQIDRENNTLKDIEMIKESKLSEADKTHLIERIIKYENDRKQLQRMINNSRR